MTASTVKKLTCLGGFLVCVCMFMCFCVCMWQQEDEMCMYLCKPEVGVDVHRSIQLDCLTSMPQDSPFSAFTVLELWVWSTMPSFFFVGAVT